MLPLCIGGQCCAWTELISNVSGAAVTTSHALSVLYTIGWYSRVSVRFRCMILHFLFLTFISPNSVQHTSRPTHPTPFRLVVLLHTNVPTANAAHDKPRALCRLRSVLWSASLWQSRRVKSYSADSRRSRPPCSCCRQQNEGAQQQNGRDKVGFKDGVAVLGA